METEGQRAGIKGSYPLKRSKRVCLRDPQGRAALAVAALAAEGETLINDCQHIERGMRISAGIWRLLALISGGWINGNHNQVRYVA